MERRSGILFHHCGLNLSGWSEILRVSGVESLLTAQLIVKTQFRSHHLMMK